MFTRIKADDNGRRAAYAACARHQVRASRLTDFDSVPIAATASVAFAAVLRLPYTKPVLTGARQVGGRRELRKDESIRLDPHDVENWSTTSDLRIMWRIVDVVVAPVGAY